MVTPVGTWRQTDLTLHGFVVSQTHVEDSLSVVYRPAVSAVWSVKLRVHSWASIHVFDRHTHTHTNTQAPLTQSPLVLHRFFLESQRQIPWYDLHFLPPSPAVWIVISCTFYSRLGETDEGRGGGSQTKISEGVFCVNQTLFTKGSLWQADMLHQSYVCVLTFGPVLLSGEAEQVLYDTWDVILSWK